MLPTIPAVDMSRLDYAKIAKNLRNRVGSVDGKYTVLCETSECPASTPSSKLHSWNGIDSWNFCPDCQKWRIRES